MIVVETFAAARAAVVGATSALVPTMGYLHDGHVSLVPPARAAADMVTMSLFVNPLQFDDPGDLERYPRDLDRDTQIAADAGVDVLFAPSIDEMYPTESRTRVRVAAVSEGMEGAHRPGHFEGVATVVAKLFAGLRPDVAVFGRKDAQQLAVVRTMALDLSFQVEVIGAPTLRAPDGLAISSRNVFLADGDRGAALGLSSGLVAAARLVEAGERSGPTLEATAAGIARREGAEVEYVSLAGAADAAPLEVLDREAFLAIAARVGGVRLIDNVFLWPDGVVDVGVPLDGESILRRS